MTNENNTNAVTAAAQAYHEKVKPHVAKALQTEVKRTKPKASVDLPQGAAAYDASLREACAAWPAVFGSIGQVKANGALYNVPAGLVKQSHANKATALGKAPGSHEWLALACYFTTHGASEPMVVALTRGPRNNCFKAAGMRPGIEATTIKRMCKVAGKTVVHRVLRTTK